MILADTGPLVALFDPADRDHARCAGILEGIEQSLCTTVPVLTEAFHLLQFLPSTGGIFPPIESGKGIGI